MDPTDTPEQDPDQRAILEEIERYRNTVQPVAALSSQSTGLSVTAEKPPYTDEQAAGDSNSGGSGDNTAEIRNRILGAAAGAASNGRADIVRDCDAIAETVRASRPRADLLEDSDVKTIHNTLKTLATACDGAFNRDDAGFNKVDAYVGAFLAELPELTREQAVSGLNMAIKYKRQLDEETRSRLADLFERVFGS